MKKLALILILMVFIISGCGPTPAPAPQTQVTALNKVEGILIEIEWNNSDTRLYKIQDSYGKTVTFKSSSNNVAGTMRVGDKVEVYFDNDFYPKKVTVRQNNMR